MPPDLFFSPPPELADCLHGALVKTLPAGRYRLPASLQPVLLIILRGRILVHADTGSTPLPGIALCGGACRPQAASAAPDTRIATASLRPGQIRRLFDPPAGQIMEMTLPLADLLVGDELAALHRFRDRLDEIPAASEATGPGQIAALWQLLCQLRARRRSVPTDLHIPAEHLHLPVAQLADRFGIGIRQFERRFAESYGQPLRSFRKQARCSTTIAEFICGGRTGDWADLAARAGYFDQAHLHRDITRFTGHSPAALAAGITRADPAFWPYQLPAGTLQRLFGPTGY